MFLHSLFSWFFVQQLVVGNTAPNFSGIDQNNKTISLSALRGKKIVLYFYPKDNTPGCTTQACNLRDNFQELLKKGIVVIGVSTDDLGSHKKFSGEYNLPFSLLPDADKKISKDYKVLNSTLGFSKRTTFLINEAGAIDHIISSPNTSNHTEEILSLWKLK